MLFDPERHEPPLRDAMERSGEAIEAIALDACRTFHPDSLWPIHPRDKDDGPRGCRWPVCTTARPV